MYTLSIELEVLDHDDIIEIAIQYLKYNLAQRRR